jgi:hypothetical protein
MSIFLLPSSLCSDLESLMNGFFWGGGNINSRGIRWKAWSKLCVKKSGGGLGFRDIQKFNISLLAK